MRVREEHPEPDRELGLGELALRVLWVALRLIFVFWLAQPGQSFVYQSF
jgi:hypothetical protein